MSFGTLMQSGGMFLGSLITCVVVIPFLILALVFFLIWRRNSQQAQSSMNWATVRGTIGATSVASRASRSSNGFPTTFYYPEVLYNYQVGGNQYLGQRITFGSELGFGNPAHAQAIVDRYVAGNQVNVYYNPNNPSDAVLERSAGTSSRIFFWIAVLILVILCITVVPMLFLFMGMNAMFSGFPFR